MSSVVTLQALYHRILPVLPLVRYPECGNAGTASRVGIARQGQHQPLVQLPGRVGTGRRVLYGGPLPGYWGLYAHTLPAIPALPAPVYTGTRVLY